MASDDSVIQILLIVGALMLLLPILMMVLAWPMMGMWNGGHMWGWEGDPVSIWGMLLMWLMPLAVILAVGYLLYRALVRSTDHRDDPALRELRLAYARGDLTDEEFETRRTRLRDEE